MWLLARLSYYNLILVLGMVIDCARQK
jgi:hypothetical protein